MIDEVFLNKLVSAKSVKDAVGIAIEDLGLDAPNILFGYIVEHPGFCSKNLLEISDELFNTFDNSDKFNTLVRDFHCRHCSTIYRISGTKEQWDNFDSSNGMVQDIFPKVSPAVREILLSKICNECFKDFFGEDDYY